MQHWYSCDAHDTPNTRITIARTSQDVSDEREHLTRTHTCGELRPKDVGIDVRLMGWVHKIRDLGSLIFIDIRDRHGITQVVARDDEALLNLTKQLRPEFVVCVEGRIE